MLKLCRKYLLWVQNSVFEGEISEANLEKLKFEISRIISEDEGDGVVIYQFKKLLYSKREVLGKDKKVNVKYL